MSDTLRPAAPPTTSLSLDWAALGVTALLALEGAAQNGADLSVGAVRDAFLDGMEKDAAKTAVSTVLGATALFFLAEREHNPRIRTFEDALVFCTTCLSVGYAQTFACTPSGKWIASALMTFGPALSARLLDRPSPRAGG